MKASCLTSILLCAGGALAFAPDGRSPAAALTTLSSSSFENEIGVTPPLGFFDPLGLLDDADQEYFNRLRYVELKHGRIAMLAVIGHLVTAVSDMT